ncbi:hypothetical protein FA15DRAFT_700257 [Coprinopsis marcescibilis]|uniref:Uncharacterized protein n=1 Tax=Coprinopsis marcescibilis TaxID=230819 RepID=A0A5C3L8G7_COPMA|nr:hypothetical protein FA15DRAFT_700257 [Coprinopsis marcescibilis]
MPFMTRRSRATTTHVPASLPSKGLGIFRQFKLRRNPNRVAGGHKAALSNPHTTRQGRKHAKKELRRMGRGNATHVPILTKIKRALGITSSRRRHTQRRTVIV